MPHIPAGLVLSVGLFHSALSSQGVTSRPGVPEDVQRHVRELVDNGWVVGMVVGVIHPNGSSYFCYGKCSSKDDRKVDEGTIFEIGSMTKVFTSLLLADLAEHKTVGLDDPVEAYLPENVTVPARDNKKITLRHLASHRSGLPRLPSNFEPKDPNNPYADYGPDRLYAFLNGYKLKRDIGGRYEYSNLGAGLLGHALSRAAGQSYEQLVINRICKPLGMNDTGITPADGWCRRMAAGHDGEGNPVKNWDLDALAGAGALRSSAQDMLKFLAANMGLTDTSLKSSLPLLVRERYPTGVPDVFVGLGWHVNTKHNTEIVWHNGGTGGYRSFCGFVPSKKLGVVVLANAGGNGSQTDPIGLHVLEPRYPLPPVKKVQTVDAGILDSYVGYYQLQPGVVFSIRRKGTGLYAQLTGQPEFPVYAESNNQFFYKVVEAQLTFVKDEKGAVTGVVLFQNGIRQTASRLGADYKPPPPRHEVPVDGNVLQAYVGKYKMFTGDVFDVTLVDGKLMVRLADQPRLQVFPESETKFFYKEVDAQITFVKDDDGRVGKLILHQWGMNLTAKKIE